MLHHLARIEIQKLEEHGVTHLSYDEVASLQSLALAVDEAVRTEGLPVGVSRPVRIGDGEGQTLWAPTCAAMDALERVSPWVDAADERQASRAMGWILAHGRDLHALRTSTTCRDVFARSVNAWANTLTITDRELADAVAATFAADSQAGFVLDVEAFLRVVSYAQSMGEKDTAEAVEALLEKLKANRRKDLSKPRANPSWGAMTARLAALTGCPPDAWAVTPSADAIDAYAARFDFEAVKAGANADEPAKRAQREALRALFSATDAIARAHKKEGTP